MEIGEYVRTKKGIIAKVTYVGELMLDTDNDVFDVGDIKAHSKNIIDLIEVGDYVNGQKVVEIDKITNFVRTDFDKYILKSIAGYEIETILTHEQYEGNSYKVVE